MSMPTFYLEEGFIEDGLITLSGKEAWHALGVRRLNVEDPIRLIDGKGKVAQATVEQTEGRHSASLRVGEITCISPQVPDIILATAIAKGDRQSTMLDMATQLGISAWQPLLCQRSVSKVGKNSYERWQRICLEACKQSGSAWLPELLPAATPEDAAREACASGREVLLAHPIGEELNTASAVDKLLLVGPEGGFTDEEVNKIIAAGAKKVSLGQNILRIETAAVSFLARFRFG
ncbi:MAG: 16S rRNA (uracil(1498)-N(3))-methyltransferase [Gammaproteobacteria bacterium]|nr:MAG: 16S rRNA (uracil(1498)-N(3))-methyltransferase [Gammaproteobacteria bacterium]